jgi:hypothetical protein
MLQVRAAGIRPGSSTVGWLAPGAALALGLPGDSLSVSAGSAPSFAVESCADASSESVPEPFPEPFAEPLPDPPLACESPGDSEARGDSDGVDGEPDGVACGEEVPSDPVLPVLPPLGPWDGLDDCDPPPLDGAVVGDAVGEVLDDGGADEVGDDVGDEVGDDGAGATGGATPGGALEPARSCCQDHPTEPPAGTVRPPTPEEEYVHAADEPSAHHRPQ